MIDKAVTVTIGDNPAPPMVECTEGDTMWRWHFRLFLAGERWTIPTGSVAVFTGKKADGNVFDLSASIANNEVIVSAAEQMTAAPGPAPCVVRVIDGSGKTVATCPVILAVRPNPQTAGPMSETVLSAYNDVLQMLGGAVSVPGSVSAWLDEHITNPDSPPLDTSLSVSGAAADSKAAGDAIADVRRTVAGIFTLGPVIAGSYVTQEGVIDDYASWSRTDYLPVDNLWQLRIKSDRASVYNAFYNASKVFISSFSVGTAETVIEVPDGAAYMVLSNNSQYLPTTTGTIVTKGQKQIEALKAANLYDLALDANRAAATVGNVAYGWNGSAWTYQGTASGVSAYNLIQEVTFRAFEAGRRYHLVFSRSDSRVYLQAYVYVGGALSLIGSVTGDTWLTIPANAEGFLLRLRVPDGAAVDGTATLQIWRYLTFPEIQNALDAANAAIATKMGYVRVLNSSDVLADIYETGIYQWLASNHPADAPDPDHNSIMIVGHAHITTGFSVQLVSTTDGKLWQNVKGSSAWFGWHEISAGSGGGGGGPTVIENTYNIVTNPAITTDANGWLQAIDTASTAESAATDMVGPILSMLTDTGYCHLGPGIFYVSGAIDMPDRSTLCGCGDETEIRLLSGVSAGYAVKLGQFCTVRDLCISGGAADLQDFTPVPGGRDGLVFFANYDGTEGPATQSQQCMVSRVWIRHFTGAGIHCRNTSINYAKGVYVEQAYVYDCQTGIRLERYSEFNKFVECCMAWCYYGAVNNSGNNVFSACTFHALDTGLLMVGSDYDANNGHGIVTGCTFCHIGRNTGKAIELDGITNGMLIEGCQIWYNSLYISNSSGVVISGCEFGRGTTGAGATIVISGGAAVLFTGCMFMADTTYPPDITVTGNDKVRWVGCYGAASGNAITG